MKITLVIVCLAMALTPSLAQKRLSYTIWADGLVTIQLPKSSFYLLGMGVRGEVSKPLRHAGNALFGQVGYGHFFQKPTSAFTATLALANVGYRYQSRKSWTASVGIGAQYWTERMRVRLPDTAIDETFTNLLLGPTVGIGFRVHPHYTVGLEYRGLFQPETGAVRIRHNSAVSIGYTF